jgi:hypothetical protein
MNKTMTWCKTTLKRVWYIAYFPVVAITFFTVYVKEIMTDPDMQIASWAPWKEL